MRGTSGGEVAFPVAGRWGGGRTLRYLGTGLPTSSLNFTICFKVDSNLDSNRVFNRVEPEFSFSSFKYQDTVKPLMCKLPSENLLEAYRSIEITFT